MIEEVQYCSILIKLLQWFHLAITWEANDNPGAGFCISPILPATKEYKYNAWLELDPY